MTVSQMRSLPVGPATVGWRSLDVVVSQGPLNHFGARDRNSGDLSAAFKLVKEMREEAHVPWKKTRSVAWMRALAYTCGLIVDLYQSTSRWSIRQPAPMSASQPPSAQAGLVPDEIM